MAYEYKLPLTYFVNNDNNYTSLFAKYIHILSKILFKSLEEWEEKVKDNESGKRNEGEVILTFNEYLLFIYWTKTIIWKNSKYFEEWHKWVLNKSSNFSFFVSQTKQKFNHNYYVRIIKDSFKKSEDYFSSTHHLQNSSLSS
jgi:hypothetical protein